MKPRGKLILKPLIYLTAHSRDDLTAVTFLWVLREFASHTVSLLWPICEINRWAQHAVWQCSRYDLTVNPTVRHSGESTVSMALAHIFSGWWCLNGFQVKSCSQQFLKKHVLQLNRYHSFLYHIYKLWRIEFNIAFFPLQRENVSSEVAPRADNR